MPAVYGLKKKITRKSRSYRRSGGGGRGEGVGRFLGNITWFSGEAEGDQLSSIEYRGGGYRKLTAY